MHPNQIMGSPPLQEAQALANWWTQHAHDAFHRLSASAPVAVPPAMQETISDAIMAYRTAKHTSPSTSSTLGSLNWSRASTIREVKSARAHATTVTVKVPVQPRDGPELKV